MVEVKEEPISPACKAVTASPSPRKTHKKKKKAVSAKDQPEGMEVAINEKDSRTVAKKLQKNSVKTLTLHPSNKPNNSNHNKNNPKYNPNSQNPRNHNNPSPSNCTPQKMEQSRSLHTPSPSLTVPSLFPLSL